MRTLALLLVACSSGSSGSSGPGPSGASGAPTSPKIEPRILPPADPLEIGRPVEREIGAQAVHRYRFELSAGNVATGVVTQNGVDVVVVTFDPSGNKLAEFDSPNGNKGPEPFSIEAIVGGAYDFEVRPFIEPSGSGAPTSGSGAPFGRYEAKLDAILTADAFAERSAKERIDSPRILELWRAVRTKRTADIEKFWTDLKGKSPIVEPYPGTPNDVLVTFVQRTRMPYVALIGGPDYREKPLVRIGDSEL